MGSEIGFDGARAASAGPPAGGRALAFVNVVEALNIAIKNLDTSVTARLGEHPDAKIFTSLPRSGQISAAQVLAGSSAPDTTPWPTD